MRIRDAGPEDAPALTPLMDQLGYPTEAPVLARRMRRLIDAGSHRFLVAEEDGRILGLTGLTWFDHLSDDRPRGRIVDVVVAREARRRGVGRMLVEEAVRLAREAGWDGVELTSNRRRAAAHAFYTALGFEQSSLKFQIRF